MGKKKPSDISSTKNYQNNPFKRLKGFAVSDSEEETVPRPAHEIPSANEKEASFLDEMDFLGVDPLRDGDEFTAELPVEPAALPIKDEKIQDDEDLFLSSLGQLDIQFKDQGLDNPKPAEQRRFKQLKQGRLIPDACLDLHGLKRKQVGPKVGFFLQNAVAQNWQTLLIITGRGLHSDEGEAILRNEAESFLRTEGKALVAEWGRAPRQHGGDGALVVFMKKKTRRLCDGD